MANYSLSFILQFFPECFQTGINNTGKTIQYMSGINKHGKSPSPYPLIFTLWYTKIENLHTTGKLETEKAYVLSSEIIETETPKKEKLGKN